MFYVMPLARESVYFQVQVSSSSVKLKFK